jgi:hypothetical protein
VDDPHAHEDDRGETQKVAKPVDFMHELPYAQIASAN